MKDFVYADKEAIHIALKDISTGKQYPVTFKGVDYIVFKPRDGIIDLYELPREGEK